MSGMELAEGICFREQPSVHTRLWKLVLRVKRHLLTYVMRIVRRAARCANC